MTDFSTTADEIPAVPGGDVLAISLSKVGRGQHLPETVSAPGSWLLFVLWFGQRTRRPCGAPRAAHATRQGDPVARRRLDGSRDRARISAPLTRAT